MNGLEVLDFGRDALWTTVWMCAPAMIAGLVVGLVIAFFQALTAAMRAAIAEGRFEQFRRDFRARHLKD